MVSRARIAELADVTRAAVTQWGKRDIGFPAPIGGDSDRFDLSEVIGWLDGRPIPASSRAPDEAADATYGDRVRQRLRPAEPSDEGLLVRSLQVLGPGFGRGFWDLGSVPNLVKVLALVIAGR